MTYSALKTALEGAGLACYEYAAPPGAAEYIVLSPYNPRLRRGDDAAVLRWNRCQLDCYSQRPDAKGADGVFVFILNTLDDLGIPFSVESCDWDNDAAAMRQIIQRDVL